MPDDPPGRFDKLASVSVQGGGVFGLTLLGQLQAVIDAGFRIVALSGTSAGAIVATLYWAGVRSTWCGRRFRRWPARRTASPTCSAAPIVVGPCPRDECAG